MSKACAATHERVYRSIRGSILSGEVLPGDKLVATRIAREHGASITPVREVLYRLAGEGMVMTSSEGFHVVPDSRTMFLDMLDLSQKLLLIGIQRWRAEGRAFTAPHRHDGDVSAEMALICLENVLAHLFAATRNEAIIAWGRNAGERLRRVRLVQCRISRSSRRECMALHDLALRGDLGRLRRQILAHHRRMMALIKYQFGEQDD